MAKIDVVKEKINYLKVWLGISGSDFNRVNQLDTNNYEKTVMIGRLGFSLIAVIWLFFFNSYFK